MAINSHDIPCDKTSLKPQNMADGHKHRKYPGHGRFKIDYTTENISGIINKPGKFKNSLDLSSPYLNGGILNLLSTVTEKCVQKKGIMSSFPLAATLYKASSHEFKVAKNKKKVKKSVLTLPSTNALLPQSCTVSDMNDAEYNKDNQKKSKKRNTPVSRKSRRRGNEYYDRDAQYLTQLNIDLDCSSTDMIKTSKDAKGKCKIANQPHDVWTVLRNINTFQFNQSPPISENSFVSPKKKKSTKRRNIYNQTSRKDMRLVETCCTEEFAYISSYEVDSRSPRTLSASSFDKVTVIDKEENFNTICQNFGDRVVKTKELVKAGKTKGKQSKNRGKYNKKNMPCLPAEPNIYGNQPDSFYGDSSFTFQNNMFQVKTDNIKGHSQEDSLIVDDRSIDTHNGSQSIDLIYSSYSGSSKGLLCQETPRPKQIRKKSPKGGDMSGITKVVFSKGSVQPSKPEQKLNNRETAFALTGPKIIPKLNQANIQRQLSKLTYPIVILGKDQLTDKPFEIIKEEPPQFNGLEGQIWPYMIEWYKSEKDCSKKSRDPRSPRATNKKEVTNDEVERILQKMRVSSGEPVKSKVPSVLKFNNRNKCEPKTYISDENKESPIYKPLQQIRSRMFKLLNNDLPETAISPPKNNTAKRQKFNALVDNVTISSSREDDNETISSRKTYLQIRQKKPIIFSSERRPWSKTKWVSEFIDNVIRKVRCGAYYTNADSLTKVSTKYILDDDSGVFNSRDLQSESAVDKALQSISKVTITKKCEPVIPIPGFDNSMPPLEIETMNSNEIAVKHCMANIILRFDVTVPTDCEMQLNKSTFMPLEISESKAKVFKCKTSIINAMLPAELCSLLPKMMKNLMESRELLDSKTILRGDKIDRLSTIPEIIRWENPLMFRITTVSPQIGRLLNGRFWKTGKLTQICEKRTFKIKYDRRLIKELTFSSRRQLLNYDIGLPLTLLTIPKENKLNTCTALVPYVPPDLGFAALSVPRLDNKINFNNVILNTVNVISNTNIFFTLTLSYPCVNMFGISSVNYVMNIPYKNELNGFKELSFDTNKAVVAPAIEYNIGKKRNQSHSIIKYYKNKSKVSRAKCKFTSNNPKEKWTSLSKIKNMNDFFKALGTSNTLSGVFDNISGRKIMSCISQMKNWTKQISSKQALLVLLLTNKRETSSLLRYRPMLLQGISVHRITKAHELDVEIQVIERERLKRIPQCEGISYLPASAENQDNLFEELYWIAKTTASDYQRPFDESQEKLLRALLGKRKKLNASYLRVMARYVGLGLLKSPGKK